MENQMQNEKDERLFTNDRENELTSGPLAGQDESDADNEDDESLADDDSEDD